jgi:hypothetical protein
VLEQVTICTVLLVSDRLGWFAGGEENQLDTTPILVKHEERIVRQMRKSASIFNRDLDQRFVATVSSIVQLIVGRNAYIGE